MSEHPNQTGKTILVITDGFPFRGADAFLHDEFREIEAHYGHVVYMPLDQTGPLEVTLAANVELDRSLIDAQSSFSTNALAKNFLLSTGILLSELFRGGNFSYVISNPRIVSRRLNQAFHLADALEKRLRTLPENTVIFSTWMNVGALGLAILKRKNKIKKFAFRVNGYDIFDDRQPGNYMRFRRFIYKMTDHVIVLSNVGRDYIRSKSVYPEKLVVNHSGIYPNALNPFDPNYTFTVVSCANLFELKRVNLLVDALKHLQIPVKWVHFGDGPERDSIAENMKDLPAHVEGHLLGHRPQEEMSKFFGSHPIHLFVHTSRTEGLGMAIIEAQSYGIPQLCCAAGGVVDVVSEKTGILIPVHTTPEELAKKMMEFKGSSMNTADFRLQVQQEFLRKFEIRENFRKLREILEN